MLLLLLTGLVLGVLPGVGLPGPIVSGVDQPYAHCSAVAAMDDEASAEMVYGVVAEVRTLRPCIGQPPFLVVRLTTTADDGGLSEELVYLGPAAFIEGGGAKITVGSMLRVDAVRAGTALTALACEVDGQAVVLRDGRGHPLWQASRVAH